jgi:hypothetical protein
MAMALTYRLYRSARLGTGTRADPYRSALTRHISEDGTGQTFEDWIQDPIDVGLARYACALADSTVHAQCVADPDITALSPECATIAEVTVYLDTPLAIVSGVRTTIETDRIPLHDLLDGANTHRELWRRLAVYHRVGNYLRGSGDAAIEILRAALSGTVGQLPAAVRTRVRNWMAERGLDSTWITNQTTVRDVITYIVNNVALTGARFAMLGSF